MLTLTTESKKYLDLKLLHEIMLYANLCYYYYTGRCHSWIDKVLACHSNDLDSIMNWCLNLVLLHSNGNLPSKTLLKWLVPRHLHHNFTSSVRTSLSLLLISRLGYTLYFLGFANGYFKIKSGVYLSICLYYCNTPVPYKQNIQFFLSCDLLALDINSRKIYRNRDKLIKINYLAFENIFNRYILWAVSD